MGLYFLFKSISKSDNDIYYTSTPEEAYQVLERKLGYVFICIGFNCDINTFKPIIVEGVC